MTGADEPRADADDVDAELRFHLDARTDALISAGLAPDEARRQALQEFGDIKDARRYMTRIEARTSSMKRRRDYMGDLAQDVRLALRRLRAAPVFALTGVVTVALGIGATTAIFSIVYGVLFRPLPFPSPEQLFVVYSANRTAGQLTSGVSAVDIDDWRAQRREIADLGGYWYGDGSSGVDLIGRGDPRRLSGVFITPGFFEALGVVPAAGRLPRETELVRGGDDRVAVLSHGFWMREFGGNADAVGSALNLSGESFTVLGVLPPAMRFPAETVDVFLPYSVIPDSSIPRLRQVRILGTVARARPGVGLSVVEQEMALITRRLAEQYPINEAWDAATVVPLSEALTGPVRGGLLVLLGAVGLVLVIACVNVAGLQLARTAGRSRELALRVALGARRGRLIRQLLTESLVLALLGGVAGLGFAYVGISALVSLSAGQLPRAAEIGLDLRLLLFGLGLAVVTGLVFGLAPAMRLRAAPQQSLRLGGRGAAGVDTQRVRTGLVVVEMAVAMVLVVGAGLMARSFLALINIDPGFNAERLLAVQFTIDGDRHDPFTDFYAEVIASVRRVPGVVAAAAVKDPPFRGNGEPIGFGIPGRPVPAGEDGPSANAIHVSDGYFRTIGARIVDGREFTPQDRGDAPLVILVNEAFARQHYPGERAVGQRLQFGGPTGIEIVGVVNDIRQVAMAEPARPTIYIHNLQNGRVKTTLVVRTAGDPLALSATIRETVWSLDERQTITAIFTFDEAVAVALAQPRLITVLLGAFGTLGLVLGVVGIYGVLASLVGQRQREIGVRLALGARPADVLMMVVRRGLLLALTGVGIGLAVAWGLGRFVTSVLYGISPTDVPTYATVAALLLASAAAASWVPARRAARLDPVQTLRAE